MHMKAKVILVSVTALTILSALLIQAGLAHAHSATPGDFPGAYGFRPGEWQYITTTTSPLLGTSRTTSMRCSHSLYQPQDTAHATLTIPGSSPGTVHCVTSHPSLHETLRNCKTISIGNENGTKIIDIMTSHTQYTGNGKHFQMQEHFSWVDNGQLFESGIVHGKWLSKTCLAHQPASITKQISPSKQMQWLAAQEAQSKAEAAQIKKTLPAEEAQANANIATMNARIAKLEAKDARAGITIPASP
ncbi:hypothetical protein [Acidithiobacillus sp.]|uniref:hypothetical protein n=1 Tax=Acidithiobacillus sp. TaxID=1872118 RepID=UPI002608C7D7|nr:hypothetical protein [Acidithiobacillus sp.]MDD5279748.1 hypothetical protein [Acidithiobacillus sp.]